MQNTNILADIQTWDHLHWSRELPDQVNVKKILPQMQELAVDINILAILN